MTNARTGEQTTATPLRLWPGVAAVTMQWLVKLALPIVAPGAAMFAVIGPLGLGLVVAVWWIFFSRAPWLERVAAIVLMVGGVAVASRFVHESIANGMMGMLLPIYAVPVMSLALVTWAVASRGLSTVGRRASMAASILLACGAFTLIRTGGITGDATSDLHWRWTPTPEQRLLAGEVLPVREAAVPPAAESIAEWSGFRGPNRDSVVRGTHIETDWKRSPPVPLWRRPVGPGWSSFAVQGDFIYTQEQRGEEEFVTCYRLRTGEPVWRHGDKARFWESNAGAGPRGTPTLDRGRVYSLGATGILSALDARGGSVVWSRNAASDTGSKIPDWGFASSPLVVEDVVIAATAGVLAAYDRDTGNPRWIGEKGGWGYSSPHLASIGGSAQIVLLNGAGAIGVAPADGRLLWKHEWRGDGIVQPAVMRDGGVLIGSGSGLAAGVGMRRIALSRGPDGWSAQERWTSNGLKPYYNDFVVHNGHAFGFDGGIVACINLEDGKRKWKGGRYGHGQMLLLADEDLLLVLSEDGELALVGATAEEFREFARVPAIEGKTWNHPVLAGEILLVRNAGEMAAFRLPVVGR